MMRSTLSSSALPCSLCGIVILLCLALPAAPCSYSYGSLTLWGWHIKSWIALISLVPCLMLLMMRQPHLHQPWRLDRCNTFIHSFLPSAMAPDGTIVGGCISLRMESAVFQQAFIGKHTTYRGGSEPWVLSSLRPPHHEMCLCSFCRPTLSLAAKRDGTRNALTSMTIT